MAKRTRFTVVTKWPNAAPASWCGHSHRTGGAAEDCGWQIARRAGLPEWRVAVVSQYPDTSRSLGDDVSEREGLLDSGRRTG